MINLVDNQCLPIKLRIFYINKYVFTLVLKVFFTTLMVENIILLCKINK